MKKALSILLALALLVGLGIVVKQKAASLGQTPAAAENLGTPVETAAAAVGPITASLDYTGTVAARQDIVISSKIPALIETLTVEEGDYVQKGQLLYSLDRSEFLSKIETLKQKINSAEINASYWDDQYRTYEELFKEGAIPEEKLQNVRLMRDTAASSLEEVRFLLGEAEANLANTSIVAPANGVITSVQSRVGEQAVPGRPMLTMAVTDELKVQTRVFEKDLALVQPGSKALITFSGLNSEPLTAKVSKVYPALDAATRAVVVEAPLKLPDSLQELVRPGMSVEISFVLGENEQATLVPKKALSEQEGKHYLFVAKEGRAMRREVKVGLEDKQRVEIIAGVKAGEKIIVSDTSQIYDGKKVYIFGEEE